MFNNRVHDIPSLPPSNLSFLKVTRPQIIIRIGGLLYLLASVGCTLAYWMILQSYVNDYVWPSYNTSGVQAFLADALNIQIWNTTTSYNLDLFNIVLAKDYSMSNTYIQYQQTDIRRIVREQLDDISVAIAGLRTQTILQSGRNVLNFCWLDFGGEWEVAHTARRQERCKQRNVDNGAFYMESTIRNIDWTSWRQKWGSQFDVAYGRALAENNGSGLDWLEKSTSALATTSLENEIAYWKSNGIVRYTIMWQNSEDMGMDDVIILRNAIQQFTIPVKHRVGRSRGSQWTSFIMCFGLWNDFNYAGDLNASLVRNATDSVVKLDEATSSAEAWLAIYPNTLSSILFHDHIGPTASVDMKYIFPPPSLINTYNSLQLSLRSIFIANEKFTQVFQAMPSIQFDMVPLSWKVNGSSRWKYYGGSVLCYDGHAQTYVQDTYGYDDGCAAPFAGLTTMGTPTTTLIAMALQGQSLAWYLSYISEICELNTLVNSSCITYGSQAARLFNTWNPKHYIALTLYQDVLSLNISLMQYATYVDNPVFLRQALVDSNSSWSFYGWHFIVDWLSGSREVIAFEGDIDTINLISRSYTPQQFMPDPHTIPHRLSYLVWSFLLYSNGILFVVLLIMTATWFLYMPKDLCGENLFYFYQVAGIVWVGRPLLFLRGATAMIILSTAGMQLKAQNGFTMLQYTPRSIWEVVIMANESLWLKYAISDIMLLFTKAHSFETTAWSSSIVWLVTVILEWSYPFVPSATMDRSCVSVNVAAQMSCVSATIDIGSWDRFLLLFGIQATGILFSWYLARRWKHGAQTSTSAPAMVPAIATYMLTPSANNELYFDYVSGVICGLVPLTLDSCAYHFNVLAWMVIPIQNQARLFIRHQISLTHIISTAQSTITLHGHFVARVGLGFLMLVMSAVWNVLFFYVSQSKLANDFLWEDFNTTGMHAFLANMYNNKLNYQHAIGPSTFVNNAPSNSDVNVYNGTATALQWSTMYSSTLQNEEITLLDNIQGLRQLDGCQVPWISAQYCYADFDRRWEMAHSSARQLRCQQAEYKTNGVVYLESVLRNSAIETCWHDALDISIHHEVSRSIPGTEWWASTQDVTTTLDEEVAYWQKYNILSYTVAWQNYKWLGILETLQIDNTFGFSNALTIKSSNGTFRYGLQTTFKMYWSFASDLNAITDNSSAINGMSFIRSSSNYAFQNLTMENLLVRNRSIASPLDGGLAVTRAALGPFGTIDLKHVPCPNELLQLFEKVDEAVINALYITQPSQLQVDSLSVRAIPSRWRIENLQFVGGNPACPATSVVNDVSDGLLCLFGRATPCPSAFAENLLTTRAATLIALIERKMIDPKTSPCSINTLCKNTTVAATDPDCVKAIESVQSWANAKIPNDTLTELYPLTHGVQSIIYSMDINLAQYVRRNTSAPIQLWLYPLFDPSDPNFAFFVWYYVADWAVGIREVIAFEGENRNLSLISTWARYDTIQPNPLETPTNVAYYCHLCIQYTTLTFFMAAILSIIYAVFVCKGHVEGWNMLVFNRVAGIVWVGRPLLFIRSIVAVGLLSTSILKLERQGVLTTLVTPKPTLVRHFLTVVAGFETSWLVAILSDVCIVFTRDHTSRYTFTSSMLIFFLVVVLSFLYPVQPKLHLFRTCHAEVIDFQITCNSGRVQIGSYQRLFELCGLTASCLFVCFAYYRLRHPNYHLLEHTTSLWLPACAHYLYQKQHWIVDDVLYLDKASAFMCGLVSFHYGNVIYLLDVKTWRTFSITIDISRLKVENESYIQSRLNLAVPMIG